MPDLNNPEPAPSVRHPRGAVRINGMLLPWVSWEVDNNAYRAADTFRVIFAAGALPAGYGLDWFGTQKQINVEIFATTDCQAERYSPAIADRKIMGQVDDLEFDPQAMTLTITGRDLTCRLIDTKGTVGYLNKTASEIATLLAEAHGLRPVVTATTTHIGTFYGNDHTSLTQERSEWDILCELARFEDFDVFVVGEELHFQPKPSDIGERYVIQWANQDGIDRANVTEMRFNRSLTIASGVIVTVKSWNAKQKKAISVSWPKNVGITKPGKSGAGTPLQYHFNHPGLDEAQAAQYARRKYDEITRHMLAMSADMPGDDLLDCQRIVAVRGTGTCWDQDFYPDSVKRSMSATPDEGYRMSVTAKNISQEYEADA